MVPLAGALVYAFVWAYTFVLVPLHDLLATIPKLSARMAKGKGMLERIDLDCVHLPRGYSLVFLGRVLADRINLMFLSLVLLGGLQAPRSAIVISLHALSLLA